VRSALALRHPFRLCLFKRALDVLDGILERFVRARCVTLGLVTKVFETSDQIILYQLVIVQSWAFLFPALAPSLVGRAGAVRS